MAVANARVVPCPTALTTALKEWAVAVDALIAGATILLLRKGGIREERGRFAVPRDGALLYPTYEHQKPHLLKSQYAGRVQPVPSGWHPETLAVQAWAQIAESFAVSQASAVEALFPFHIWNEQFVRERLGWKPQQPLSILLLRVYRLDRSQDIPYRSEYGGCRSWIELASPISTANSSPVLSEVDFAQQVSAIRQIVESSS